MKMSKELTEQWRNGTLKEGVYWCEIIESPYVEQVHLPCCDDIVVEVLAPVPSYKEWKQLKDLLKEYKKQLSEIKNAYIELTTQDEYGSYYIDEAKLFVEIVGKITKDYGELELKHDDVLESGLGNVDDVYLKVIDENQQLKELLRECREVLKIVIYGSLNNLNNPRHGAIYLLPKIDKAIGEK